MIAKNRRKSHHFRHTEIFGQPCSLVFTSVNQKFTLIETDAERKFQRTKPRLNRTTKEETSAVPSLLFQLQ